MADMIKTLYKNATLATMEGATSYGLLRDAAIGTDGDHIVWIGASADAPASETTIDCASQLITPALIDCHTHLVYGGNRAAEFEMRLEGATYEQISNAGGGIRSTVRHTREASLDSLLEDALPRVDHLIAEGVATVEIKSGYGLDVETELKQLRVARQIADVRNIRVKTSFLGAHALPPDYAGSSDDYIDFVCQESLPAAIEAGLVDTVDGFCEGIAFSPTQMKRVFDVAAQHKLPIKLHAEQLSDLGGAVMAATQGALSADHLEFLTPSDAAILAQFNTTAVLLPGAFYMLRETQLPPIDAFRDAGVRMAIATDNNPGSSPLNSLLTTMNMACTLFRMTPEEALRGVTTNAAAALGIEAQCGSLAVGKRAELALWNVAEPAELAYRVGFNPLVQRVIGRAG